MSPSSCLLLVAGAVLFGGSCVDPSSEPASPRQSSELPSTAAPVASVEPTPSVAPVAESPGQLRECMMLHHCGCNVGCNGVDVPPDGLKEGLEVRIASGESAGKQAFVVRAPQIGGGEVLALSYTDPSSGIMVCGSPSSRNLLGFGCAKEDAGPVPRNACRDACR